MDPRPAVPVARTAPGALAATAAAITSRAHSLRETATGLTPSPAPPHESAPAAWRTTSTRLARTVTEHAGAVEALAADLRRAETAAPGEGAVPGPPADVAATRRGPRSVG